MNYNIIALFLIDFVINTNRETISFIYTQNLPRNRVSNTQNPKTYMYIIINESKHLHGYYWLGYPRALQDKCKLASWLVVDDYITAVIRLTGLVDEE